MNPDRPSGYEELTLEAAARVDAACDGFEKAWKATRSGAEEPRLSSFLDSCSEPERTILARELLELDQACRKRYGLAGRSENSDDLGVVAEYPSCSPTRLLRGHTHVPTGQLTDWPRIPGLELVQVLGSGGMGVVLKARQVSLDRDVAVKFLRDAHGADWGQRERFLQEARAVARLRHSNLVQVYEFGEVPSSSGATSQPYLVLEYVSGGSLADLIRGSPQPPSEAARLVETLADAIHYAHHQGVIHRDLKPANVLLQGPGVRGQEPAGTTPEVGNGSKRQSLSHSTKGCQSPLTTHQPKVTDFGLAKFLAGSDLTRSGEVLGTPGYMAPEQAVGTFGSITAAVDVYGLGAILYEALTGRPPFQAETAVATVNQVRFEDPVPPRRLQPTVPRDLETICLKCLRKEPGRRYMTAQDLADDLRRFQAAEPIRARPVGTGERVIVWCRRKPAVAALLVALVLVFLAGSFGVLWQWQLAKGNAVMAEQNAAAYLRERDTARQEKDRAQGHLKIVQVRVGVLERLGEDLYQKPGMYRTGQAVLKEALNFYRDLLPEEGDDPVVRREATKLYGRVAWIHHMLGQEDEAVKVWDHQAKLLTDFMTEDPTDKALRMGLADCYRWQGHALRFQGKAGEARKAYVQATQLHKDLLDELPNDPTYQVALGNTLLNMAWLPSSPAQAEERELLWLQVLKHYRAAVQAAPNDPRINAELALGLEGLASFYLGDGRPSQGEAPVQEAQAIYQKIRANGQVNSSIERAEARNLVCLGRVLAATDRAGKAEDCYRQAGKLLDGPVKGFPESALRQEDQAMVLAGLADLLKDPARSEAAEEIRRRVIRVNEKLQKDFPDNPQYQFNLAWSYLKLASLLCELGRLTEADEPYRKALALESEDAGVNNDLAWFLATSPESRLRDPARAVRLAKKAVKVQPESANNRNTLGVAYFRNGDDKSAVTELEAAVRLGAGGNNIDWLFLAMAYWRLGDHDQAQKWFDRAAQWMDNHKAPTDEHRRFRAEADAMLMNAGSPKAGKNDASLGKNKLVP
jgi:serine/threonine-protein kinase